MAGRELLKDKKILIVDDEPDVLEVLYELLPDCEITKAEDFEKAKGLLENQYFDIAILDIMGVDGYKLLTIAREKKVIPVMLTAHALSPDHIMRSYEMGAASYLPKDEITNITVFLEDILEARAKGKSTWERWYERLASTWEKKFGPDWQTKEKEFWTKFPTL